MADALNPIGHVYAGFWTEWTKGSIKGLTWTLTPTCAIIMTNSLAVFVTLCSIQLWTIVRFILHQRGASTHPGASTPHLNKQQLILRNASSASATARLMLELAWTSRTSKDKPSLRAYSIGLSAIIYTILFMAAGVFSNKSISASLTNGGSAVLLRNDNCGVWNQTYYDVVANQKVSTEEDFGMYAQYIGNRAHDVQLSLQYAQECYLSQAALTSMSSHTCRALKSSTVGWEKPPRTGSCPFEPQMCHGTAETVVLDTGEIDSHHNFGINAKRENRLTYRRVTTCAVLNGTSHVQGWNGTMESSSSVDPSPNTAYAYYGPSLNQKTEWTYSYSNFASFYTNFSAKTTKPYQVGIEQARPASNSNDFEPLPGLAQKDSDLNLILMSYTGMYLEQINDPWFSANGEHSFDSENPLYQKRYTPDEAISTIGCTEQHKFCTSNNTCTEFLGFDQVQTVDSFNAALTPKQNATFDRILRAVAESRLEVVVAGLAVTTTTILASNATLVGKSGAVLSQALPDGQWKLELGYWHSVAMAQLQRTVVRWATGQIAAEPQYVQYLLRPTEPQDIWFCDNMIVPSTVYQSFSVMATILIVLIGTMITVTSLFIEDVAPWNERCFRESASRKHWDHDDLLELRRPTTKSRRRRQEVYLFAHRNKPTDSPMMQSGIDKV